MKTTPFILAAALATGAVDALAAQAMQPDDRGFYLSGSWGVGKVDIDNAAIDASARAAGFATSSTTSDDKESTWKVAIGYQFSRHIALELSYLDIGDYTINTVTTGPAANVAGRIDGKAWAIDLIGILPLNPQFDLFAKIGAHRWDIDANVAAIAGGAATTANVSADGTDWKFGLGARWNVTRNFGVQLEWDRYNDIGSSSTTGKSDLDYVGIGLRFKW